MGKRYSLLFVDNEEKILRSLSSIFRRDYDVYFANSEFDALDILSYQPIDIVVTDQQLPGMKGRDLLQLIQQQYPHIVRLLLVKPLDKKYFFKDLNAGDIFDIINKPWCVDEIKTVIRRAVKASQMESYKTILTETETETEIAPRPIQAQADPIDEPPAAKRILDNVVVSTLPVIKAKPLKLTENLTLTVGDVSKKALVNHKKTAVLLMEKDQRVRNSIRAISKRFGFEIYSASSYVQAVNTFGVCPDIGVAIIGISTDLKETLEALRLFKQYCPDLSVLALAEVSDASVAIRLINEGKVFRYLQKPINPIEFDNAVVAGIKRHRMLQKVGALSDRYRDESDEMITKSGMQKLKEILQDIA
ncbi:MAG: response regulator [Cellvibrionaceae bacterium]